MSRTSHLIEYHKKRDFNKTGEPKGSAAFKKSSALQFVIQKHGARRLHYDFRLELDGVMKSWAVTRGPSYNPGDKRLAVQTEDHPVEYNKFEGVIPEKQYGAGPVMIWDAGTWEPVGDVHKSFKKGHITFELKGRRMKGRWHLVLMKGNQTRKNWLLIKGDDKYALESSEAENYLDQINTSIISGRTLEDIQNGVAKKNTEHFKAETIVGNLQEKYNSIELATLVEFPPDGEGWLHEIKYDGYRILAFIQDGNVVLQTRGRQDWTYKFPTLARELGALKVRDAVLDGEIAVLNNKGATSFSLLQAALTQGQDKNIEIWFFDLLYLDGKDYADKPLLERKAALKKLLAKFNSGKHIYYSEHFESDPDLLEKACYMGAEGIVSKNKSSVYRGRRIRDWVKSKCGLEQEFVIGGYTLAKNKSQSIGSLLLGFYQEEKFLYAGKVGTGFNHKEAIYIYQKLNPLKTDRSPFDNKVENSPRKNIWVKPSVLCEVSFWEWTPDKRIRHASFKGLREDKSPRQVHEEIPEKPPGDRVVTKAKAGKKSFTVEGISITHPDREIYPGMGITKGDVAIYYARALPYLLPFAENRLMSLFRCTETIQGECFFQRAPMKGGKGNVYGLTVDHKEKKHNYLYVTDYAGIIELVQFGAIEFHGWQSQVKDVNKPDQIVFDLDPAEDVSFEAVKLSAQDVRNRLDNIGLVSFPRVTGGKGIHVTVPLKPHADWDQIKTFTRNFARQMEKENPDIYVSNMSKIKRKGKIFVDYLRNDFSSTAIIPFSLRSRAGAPIATLVSWSELLKLESAAEFTFSNIKKKFSKRTEGLMEEFFQSRQKLKL